ECIVNQYPRWLVQQDARERETQLLVLAQLPVPAAGAVEQRHHALQAEPAEGPCEVALRKALHLQRIGNDFAQRPSRQVRGTPGQEKDVLVLRTTDPAD